jgi:hypothetical protein
VSVQRACVHEVDLCLAFLEGGWMVSEGLCVLMRHCVVGAGW